MRVCNVPGCPNLIDKPGKCPQHAREAEKRRGTRQQRGYGNDHQKLRAKWAPKVAAGKVRCWRCGKLIQPGTPWDLGHDDNDRTRYRGPEHAYQCNRSAGGKAAHRK